MKSSTAQVAAQRPCPPALLCLAPPTEGWQCEWCQKTLEQTRHRRKGPSGPATLCHACGILHYRGASRPAPPTEGWRCEWCQCTLEQTRHRLNGPNGPATLCSACGMRHGKGAFGPALPSGPPTEGWQCEWCQRTLEQTRRRRTGPSGPATLCESCGNRHYKGARGPVPPSPPSPPPPPTEGWQCEWCQCTFEQTSHRLKGPSGPATLCNSCGMRHRYGDCVPAPPTEGWQCEWCQCTFEQTSHRLKGPSGPATLCNSCGMRHRYGDCVPAPPTEGWQCEWCQCTFEQTSHRLKGPSGPATLCNSCGMRHRYGDCVPAPPTEGWQCEWCQCSFEQTGRRRKGPSGPSTLCNSCGLRHRRGANGPALSLRPPTEGWRCEKCDCTFKQTRRRRTGPSGPATLCDSCGMRHYKGARGSAAAAARGSAPPPPPPPTNGWQCEWCQCTFEQTVHRVKGPSGPATLCESCGLRHSRGDNGTALPLGPPTEGWRCEWCDCTLEQTSGRFKGPSGPATLCVSCGPCYHRHHRTIAAASELGDGGSGDSNGSKTPAATLVASVDVESEGGFGPSAKRLCLVPAKQESDLEARRCKL